MPRVLDDVTGLSLRYDLVGFLNAVPEWLVQEYMTRLNMANKTGHLGKVKSGCRCPHRTLWLYLVLIAGREQLSEHIASSPHLVSAIPQVKSTIDSYCSSSTSTIDSDWGPGSN